MPPLFTFDRADEAEWEVVNDGVMGGRSAGIVTVADGILRFTGTLVTRGGGFTSVRAARDFDLSTCDGLVLRVRGDGRRYELEVTDDVRFMGRRVSRRASFATTGEWRDVRVAFAALRASVFGRPVPVPSLERARVRSVGLYLIDRIDGSFRLEVARISAHGSGDDRGASAAGPTR